MYTKTKMLITRRLVPLATAFVMLCSTSALQSAFVPQLVRAQNIDDLKNQASELETMIAQNKATADGLTAQVETLKGKIAELDADIISTQNKIDATEKRIAELNGQLVKTQADLDRQREILKSNLKQLYKTTGATSVELLFASDDFSSFINKQEYLDQLKNGIKTSLDSVIALKKQLETTKTEQEELQTGQLQQKKDLEATKTERTDLLTKTQGDESKYRAIVEEMQKQQQEINRQIAAAATRVTYTGTGSYPWADVGGDSWWWLGDYGSDPWGMGYRQCVSYTAWKVASSGRFMPTNWTNGRGNAGNWPNLNAEDRANGITVDRTPHPGDVAIWSSGSYGHAAYVEEVYGNGTMLISQYNYDFDGRYSSMVLPSSRWDLKFVHFP
jgi:surface antigen